MGKRELEMVLTSDEHGSSFAALVLRFIQQIKLYSSYSMARGVDRSLVSCLMLIGGSMSTRYVQHADSTLGFFIQCSRINRV